MVRFNCVFISRSTESKLVMFPVEGSQWKDIDEGRNGALRVNERYKVHSSYYKWFWFHSAVIRQSPKLKLKLKSAPQIILSPPHTHLHTLAPLHTLHVITPHTHFTHSPHTPHTHLHTLTPHTHVLHTLTPHTHLHTLTPHTAPYIPHTLTSRHSPPHTHLHTLTPPHTSTHFHTPPHTHLDTELPIVLTGVGVLQNHRHTSSCETVLNSLTHTREEQVWPTQLITLLHSVQDIPHLCR